MISYVFGFGFIFLFFVSLIDYVIPGFSDIVGSWLGLM